MTSWPPVCFIVFIIVTKAVARWQFCSFRWRKCIRTWCILVRNIPIIYTLLDCYDWWLMPIITMLLYQPIDDDVDDRTTTTIYSSTPGTIQAQKTARFAHLFIRIGLHQAKVVDDDPCWRYNYYCTAPQLFSPFELIWLWFVSVCFFSSYAIPSISVPTRIIQWTYFIWWCIRTLMSLSCFLSEVVWGASVVMRTSTLLCFIFFPMYSSTLDRC